ncbi:MAG: dTDP-4-dehydrorhamnose reductase [Nitrospirae bacterium RBG_16_64_22]|nr:MAG: dTDP-4-dehydrorhamnose reductase [Nitrospirae bacterium RBG_16_64_22]
MRVLVTGANGMLGRDLVPVLAAAGHETAGATRAAFDVTDRDETLRAIGEAAPDLVVHAAAYTRVDDAEREPEKAFAVNHGGTRNVADACGMRGARLLYVSTDYVFDGTVRTPYREADPTNPLSVYARSKRMGEREVERLGNDGLIVRTSWLYGPHGPNFVEAILRQARERGRLTVVNDQEGAPTYTADLAEAIVVLLDHGAGGKVHFSGAGSCTWFEFAREIVSQAGMSRLGGIEVLPVTSESRGRPAPRPAYSVLCLDRYVSLTARRPPEWKEALGRYLERRGCAALKPDNRHKEVGIS